jgi:hypothetical protein
MINPKSQNNKDRDERITTKHNKDTFTLGK